MLDVAREKFHGSTIEWIESSAQEFRARRSFDLAIMTGHAFQVLLNDEDIEATLRNIHGHLRSGGRFVFESRNPAINWSARWNYDQFFEVDGTKVLQETRCGDPMWKERICFEHRYKFPDETLVSNSELRFVGKDRIIELLGEADFNITSLLGDWTGGDYDPATSDEMIFITQRS
jgi:ubiquinone/menaquinone biosynthesis C-methylase UbiE